MPSGPAAILSSTRFPHSFPERFPASANQKMAKRPYDLGKRIEKMDRTRMAVLRAAITQLKTNDHRKLTMSWLADQGGVTRQTVYKLFGSKAAIIQEVLDAIVLDGGMDKIHEALTLDGTDLVLERFIEVFCQVWTNNRLLTRRIHEIRDIEPAFDAMIEMHNRRRLAAAKLLVKHLNVQRESTRRAAALSALTSFEFFDTLIEASGDENVATSIILELAQKMLFRV